MIQKASRMCLTQKDGNVVLLPCDTPPSQSQRWTYTDTTDDTRFTDVTRVGINNAYNQRTSGFGRLVDALDSGAGMIELDVWQGWPFAPGYRVQHDEPVSGSDQHNNCTRDPEGMIYDKLREGTTDGSFGDCLDNLRAWHDHNPSHNPLIIKLQLMNPFDSSHTPDRLDGVLAQHLGAENIFKPADLIGSYQNLDAASRAGNWPTFNALKGKFIIVDIRGPVVDPLQSAQFEQSEQVYASNLHALHDTGKLGQAMMFPALLNVQGSNYVDPRLGVKETSVRPWFVAFDGDAGGMLSKESTDGGARARFYKDGRYLLTLTNVHQLTNISNSDPTSEQALAAIKMAAGLAATTASSHWRTTNTNGFVVRRA
jgi:hypothetical protein